MAPFLHDPRTVTPNRIFDSSIKSCSGNITAALVQWVNSSLWYPNLKRTRSLQTSFQERFYSQNTSHDSGGEKDLERVSTDC